MANFITSDYAVDIVRGLLATITRPKYMITTPDFKSLGQSRPAEYIVINSLPIGSNVMQKCYVNVNYHVKDQGAGIPDITKINSGSAAVMVILEKVTESNYMIDYEGQETFREDALGEHYSNLRFSFKFINK